MWVSILTLIMQEAVLGRNCELRGQRLYTAVAVSLVPDGANAVEPTLILTECEDVLVFPL